MMHKAISGEFTTLCAVFAVGLPYEKAFKIQNHFSFLSVVFYHDVPAGGLPRQPQPRKLATTRRSWRRGNVKTASTVLYDTKGCQLLDSWYLVPVVRIMQPQDF